MVHMREIAAWQTVLSRPTTVLRTPTTNPKDGVTDDDAMTTSGKAVQSLTRTRNETEKGDQQPRDRLCKLMVHSGTTNVASP